MSDSGPAAQNPFIGLHSSGPRLPPPPFDLRLDFLPATYAANLWALAEAGAIDAFIRDGKKWINRDDIQDYLPAGACTYDPQSPTHIPSQLLLDYSTRILEAEEEQGPSDPPPPPPSFDLKVSGLLFDEAMLAYDAVELAAIPGFWSGEELYVRREHFSALAREVELSSGAR